jgi:hypothetical protein
MLRIGLAFLLVTSVAHAAECANRNAVIVDATEVESKAACDSLATVMAFFQSIGAETNPKITFVFEDQVLTPAEKPADRIPVFGYFDTVANSIHMTHFESPIQKGRQVWGQNWSDELAASMLLHEAAHLVAISYMGDRFRDIPHFGHEFIAYAVQFAVMRAQLRENILEANPLKPFENLEDVSQMAYEFDPHGFGVRAYLWLAIAGNDSIKKILDGELRFFDQPFTGY